MNLHCNSNLIARNLKKMEQNSKCIDMIKHCLNMALFPFLMLGWRPV